MPAKRGKPENVLIADLSEEWGSPLAILKDSCCYIVATQVTSAGKWGGNNNKYYSLTYGVNAVFQHLRNMCVAKKTKKAEGFANLCEQVMTRTDESDKLIKSMFDNLKL